MKIRSPTSSPFFDTLIESKSNHVNDSIELSLFTNVFINPTKYSKTLYKFPKKIILGTLKNRPRYYVLVSYTLKAINY